MSEVGITAGSEGAQYRIEINTDFTEPGWNVGVMRQNASVDLSCKVKKIETGEQVATIKIEIQKGTLHPQLSNSSAVNELLVTKITISEMNKPEVAVV
jgi:molybdopterin-binding protein